VTPEVVEAIERCRSEVSSDPKHQLSFRTRRELLRVLGPQRLDAKGYGVELVSGKRRRVSLALRVARRVAPFWVTDFGTPALDVVLDTVERYLTGAAAISEVRRRTDSLQGALLNDPQGKDRAYLAGRATAAAGWVAVGDEVLSVEAGVTPEELDDPQDPDQWDPAFFAAGAWAGGMPWMAAFVPDRYLEFWTWYLDDAVPAAWSAAA
jgi:hypothetical protein